MIIIRLLIIAFNVGLVAYLIYRLLEVGRSYIEQSRKAIIITTGVFLIVIPAVMLAGVIRPSMIYFIIYPVAISFLLYLIRNTGV